MFAVFSIRITRFGQDFFRAESAESAEALQERGSTKSSFSATFVPLRAHVPSGSVLIAARSAGPWNVPSEARCFEEQKTEKTEHHLSWSTSLFHLWPVRIVCLIAAGRFVLFCGKSVFGCGPPRCASARNNSFRGLLFAAVCGGKSARLEKDLNIGTCIPI
jgi:hypothetical protein